MEFSKENGIYHKVLNNQLQEEWFWQVVQF